MKDTHTTSHCEPLTSASGARFDGFFDAGNRRSYGKEKLLDARARRIFDMTKAACEHGVYPYQIALQGRSGPWVRVEGRDMLSLSAYDYQGLIWDPRIDEAAKDARDAATLYSLVKDEVKPLFFERDERGIPKLWLQRVRASMRTLGPKYCTTRMLDDYVKQVYAPT